MSDFITFASSAAVGSLLGLVLKELLDLWRSTRIHRHELQRRYFDAKLDATIRAIQQIKTASTTLRSILGVMRQNEDDNGWIDPDLFTNVFQPTIEIMQRVNEQAAGVIALIGFYYDSGLAGLVQQGTAPPTPFDELIRQFHPRSVSSFADKLDHLADRIIGLMRDTYEGIRC